MRMVKIFSLLLSLFIAQSAMGLPIPWEPWPKMTKVQTFLTGHIEIGEAKVVLFEWVNTNGEMGRISILEKNGKYPVPHSEAYICLNQSRATLTFKKDGQWTVAILEEEGDGYTFEPYTEWVCP